MPTAEEVKPSLVRGNTGSEADKEVLCHMYLWMYNQETRHFPNSSQGLYGNLLVQIQYRCCFQTPRSNAPFSDLSRYPPALQFRAQHLLARLFFLPATLNESRVTNNGSTRNIPTGDPAAKRGCLSSPGCRRPSCA